MPSRTKRRRTRKKRTRRRRTKKMRKRRRMRKRMRHPTMTPTTGRHRSRSLLEADAEAIDEGVTEDEARHADAKHSD
jgi:hypothetical protein